MKLQSAVAAAALATLAGCGEEVRRPKEPGAIVVAGRAGLGAYFDCLDDKGVTLVSAHRGGPARGFPENAIATFSRTLNQAPALLEVDVRRTKDGVLVLMHDEDLERTTTCTGRVEDREALEVLSCRLKDRDGYETAFRPPHLIEALKWAEGRTVLQLDVKPEVRFEHVVHDIRSADAYDRVVVITYSLGAAAALARVDDRVLISVTIESEADLDELERRGVALDRVLAWTGNDAPDPELFDALERRDVPVIFGTLGGRRSIDNRIAASGSNDEYAELAELGVDVLSTDRPGVAFRALKGHETLRADLAACAAG